MTTDQLISQLVTALRDMTPTQHSSWCMEHEGGVVDGPDGRRVGVGPLVVGTCRCDANVKAARAALTAHDAHREREAMTNATRLPDDLAGAEAENSRLRHAAAEVLSWSLNDMTALLTNPPQNAALFHAQRLLREAMGD